jgi:hypothetical protein
MHYILNTNTKHSKQDHEHMLAHGRAAAFCERKSLIDRLDAGDEVFLYQSGVGIVGFGVADGRVVICSHNGAEGEEHHMMLREFKQVAPPLTAAQIKEITGKNYQFTPTLFRLCGDGGKKVSDFIHEHCLGA